MDENISPDLFWQAMSGYQVSAAIKAAIETDVFTAIDNGAKTAAEIGSATGAHERGVRILCDSLTVLGFLTKDGGKYDLTPSTAAFLSRNSHSFVGSAVDFLLSPMLRKGFDDLTNGVKNGGSLIGDEASLSPESPMWVDFARSMMPLMFPPAQMIAENVGFEPARKLNVLDIAAGHGIFGIMVAQRYPNAEVYALDWANVLTVATENAEKFGVADRHHLIPGSAFDVEYGEGYDLVLLTNFLHHFDVETCEKLIRKIGNSLNDGGKVMTLEFIPNDDRISPPAEAMFSLVMLAGTPGGDAYTFAELKQMFENAGFSRNEHIPLLPTPQHLVISQK